jgi:hypothetical protein
MMQIYGIKIAWILVFFISPTGIYQRTGKDSEAQRIKCAQ